MPYNKAFHKVIHEARTALQAADAAGMTEQGWNSLEHTLAGCVPDFGRNTKNKDRKELLTAVIQAIVHAQYATFNIIKA